MSKLSFKVACVTTHRAASLVALLTEAGIYSAEADMAFSGEKYVILSEGKCSFVRSFQEYSSKEIGEVGYDDAMRVAVYYLEESKSLVVGDKVIYHDEHGWNNEGTFSHMDGGRIMLLGGIEAVEVATPLDLWGKPWKGSPWLYRRGNVAFLSSNDHPVRTTCKFTSGSYGRGQRLVELALEKGVEVLGRENAYPRFFVFNNTRNTLEILESYVHKMVERTEYECGYTDVYDVLKAKVSKKPLKQPTFEDLPKKVANPEPEIPIGNFGPFYCQWCGSKHTALVGSFTTEPLSAAEIKENAFPVQAGVKGNSIRMKYICTACEKHSWAVLFNEKIHLMDKANKIRAGSLREE